VHVGWCLNQSGPLPEQSAGQAPPAPPVEAREQLAGFIEDGLGGLERAVLQLEIGAGRDSRTVRAALRLGPRQYAHHRQQGLSKLRDVITGSVNGQVCDHHLHSVVLAATGDRAAADALAGGAGRCRSCSREAQGLRRLLHERLALAPWPFVVKPGSVIAAKLAALGAIGKSASGGGGVLAGAGAGAGSAGSVAIPTVLAVAALATGGGAAIGASDGPADRAKGTAGAVAHEPAGKRERSGAKTSERAAKRRFAAAGRAVSREERRAARKQATVRPASGGGGSGQGGATTPARSTAPAAPTTTTAAAPAPAPTTAPQGPAGTVIQKVDDTVDDVQKTVGDATKPILPPQVTAPVDQTVDTVQDTVDQVGGTVGGTVDSLLAPKP
jgi:hypothetical protein